MLKQLIKKMPFKLSKVWVLTFFLSSLFIFTAIPFTKFSAAPAGQIYLYHRDEKSDVETGFLTNLAKSISNATTGSKIYTNNYIEGNLPTYRYEGGMLPTLAAIGDTLYETPTASAIIWAQDQYNMVMGNGKFVSMAYNSNDVNQYYVSGFSALSPIIGIWNWSRNIVYGIFIVILIAVAFMILFRQQLNGQQYITITNSLPSIVLSLVLITFSFPLSAVFIDIVSIGSNVAYNLIISSPSSPGYQLVNSDVSVPKVEEGIITPPETDEDSEIELQDETGFVYTDDKARVPLQNVLQPDDPQMSIWSIFYTSNAKICAGIPLITEKWDTPLELTPNADANCKISKYVMPAALNGIFGGTIDYALNQLEQIQIPSIFLEVLIILVILSTQFKLLKIIFEAYMILSFFPIVSPWIFLLAAIPNRTQKAITDYVKILGGAAFNLIIIYVCFLLLIVFGYSSTFTDYNGSEVPDSILGSAFRSTAELKWVPPMLGYSYGQIVGNSELEASNQKLITTLVIVLFFLTIPRIPDEIRGWLQIPELPPILRGAAQDLGQKSQETFKYGASAYGKLTQRGATMGAGGG